MKYYIFRLSFPNGAHFGDGNLDSYNMTFHADTLFSALFIEAVKSGGAMADRLLRAAREGKLVLSDGFPYIEDTFKTFLLKFFKDNFLICSFPYR